MNSRPNTKTRWLLWATLLGFTVPSCTAFAPSLSADWKIQRCFHLSMTTENDGDDSDDVNEEDPPIAKATVKIDDGGSDLTDRFKWKVNALMGVFDPQDGADDDRQEGNILNAILNFPVRYTFNIVGRTSGDSTVQDDFVEAVKKIVMATSGDDIACQITPRGKNFTKVQCEAEVQNAAMINTIYEELEKLERTVMRF
jgi:putative lipoic acid-binding regulatory protein